jgi:hypothetical protein
MRSAWPIDDIAGMGLVRHGQQPGAMTDTLARKDIPAVRAMLRRPPVWLGVAVGGFGLADVGPFEPSGPTTWVLPLLALGYLVFGAFRGALRRPGVLRLQLAGVLGFTSVALVALVVDPVLGQYLVAAGWVGHAAWDFAHRDGSVVPRWYAQFCIVVDLFVAASLVLAPVL